MKIVAVLISALSTFISQAEGAVDCTTAEGCGQCIKLSPECAWCEDPQYIFNGQPRPRCDTFESHGQYKCKAKINPKSKKETHSELPLDHNDEIKVTPQNLTMYLRPGQPSNITVKMKTPENFPVDLYFLMDISGSMAKDLKRLTTLGRKIGKEMKNITEKFRLGFGSFVDKPLAPYIDTYPAALKHPKLDDKSSVPAFGFSNVLPLTPSFTDFENTVNSLSISGNVDNPEGGLDALMQVAVCDKDIGWAKKEEARRLVIFASDAAYHFAGDGLLGGVVKPNDGQCYTENGIYKASTVMDYPSVGFLRQVLVDNQVVPIFAITSTNKELYEELAKYFGDESGAVADQLNQDSSNIVPLIRQAYEKIAQTQTIRDTAPEGVEVSYTAVCPNGVHVGSKTCTNVEIGQEVSFIVSVTVKDCNIQHDSFALKTAFGDVHIKLSYICSCDCEKKENMELNSPHCSRNGTLHCGKCACNVGRAGRICQCLEETKLDEGRCQSSNQTDYITKHSAVLSLNASGLAGSDNGTGKVCSGRGQCLCGECSCSASKREGETIDGKNCECSNKNCARDSNSGLMCGGHGKCVCNKCVCSGNWTGESCSCTKEKAGCLKDGVLCSGRGTCECGKCVCNASSPFRGAFCDECPSCAGKCAANKDCVQCSAYGTGELAGDRCDEECKDLTIVEVEEVTSDMGERCSFLDVDDCSFVFAYQTDDNKKFLVSVEKEKQCPKEASALAIILGVVGGILGVGLALLLIWKLLATIQDRREFAKFEKDRQNAKWDTGENPIFKQATTTFQNPTYGGR